MALVEVRPPATAATRLRWKVADGAAGERATLFPGLVAREVGRGEFRGLEFLHVEAKSIITRVPDAARLPFRHTVNPYRGCSHACTYCFARPTHEYLNLGSGRDFDTKIVVKVNAAERLRAELRPRRWAGDPIALGTNTDPYQQAEGKYHLTRGIVEVLAEHANPFSILTKSTLLLRDLDLLAHAASVTEVSTCFSIGTLDEEVWRLTEPGTPHPRQRVAAVARLNEAGVPCGVLIAPVIPGLSDAEGMVEDGVDACVDAGATSIAAITLHLRRGVRDHFFAWLGGERPDLIPRYRDLYARRRSDAPERVRAGIQSRVRSALARRGRVANERNAHRGPPPDAARDPAGHPAGRQLRLGL